MKLTNRQSHVLQLTARGLTVKGVARELKLSRSTVEKHLINIRTSLSAKNITNAVYIACKIGIIVYAGVMIFQTDNYRRASRTARREQSSCVIFHNVA